MLCVSFSETFTENQRLSHLSESLKVNLCLKRPYNTDIYNENILKNAPGGHLKYNTNTGINAVCEKLQQ